MRCLHLLYRELPTEKKTKPCRTWVTLKTSNRRQEILLLIMEVVQDSRTDIAHWAQSLSRLWIALRWQVYDLLPLWEPSLPKIVFKVTVAGIAATMREGGESNDDDSNDEWTQAAIRTYLWLFLACSSGTKIKQISLHPWTNRCTAIGSIATWSL